MNNAVNLCRQYLNDGHIVQLATILDGRPLVCSVYFVADKHFNLYWLSYPTRRHSRAIEANGLAAVTMMVKPDIPVVGIQMEGKASLVTRKTEVATVMARYVAKYGVGKRFLANFAAHKNKHCLYKLSTEGIALFDELHFGADNVQKIDILVI